MSLPRQYPIPDDIYHAPEETSYSVAEYIALLNGKLKPLKATIQGEKSGLDHRVGHPIPF
jgi:hypothetical protein